MTKNGGVLRSDESGTELVKPQKHATRDAPSFPEDTGWQFTCGQSSPHREEEGLVWALSEVLKLDPSVSQILSAPCQSSFERSIQNMQWHPVQYSED